MELYGSPVADTGHKAWNYVAIISTSCCVNDVCYQIEKLIRGTKFFPENPECSHASSKTERLTRTLIELGRKPDVAAVLLVGLGCETIVFESVLKTIRHTGKLVRFLVVHHFSEILETVNRGAKIATDMVLQASSIEENSLAPSNHEEATPCCPGLKKCMKMLMECGRDMSAQTVSTSQCLTEGPFELLCETADGLRHDDASTTLHEAASHSDPEFWQKMGISEEYALKELPALKQWLDSYRQSGFCDHLKAGLATLH